MGCCSQCLPVKVRRSNMTDRTTAIQEFFRTHNWLQNRLLTCDADGQITGACLAGAEQAVAGDWNEVTPAVGRIAREQFPERMVRVPVPGIVLPPGYYCDPV